uniref:Uncharacterized protein n=1 Tax=Prolemur simus TaxID=1328070 RepID=A0A8C8YZ01_PROSS
MARTELHMQRVSIHSYIQTLAKTHIRTGSFSYMVEPKASCMHYTIVFIWESMFTYQSRQFIPVMFNPLHEEVLITVLNISKHSYKNTHLFNTFT